MLLALLFSVVARASDGVADILNYEIGPGDLVWLEVVGQPDMTGDARISGDGMIMIPQARSVSIAGLTLDQARDVITSTLAKGYLRSPQVLINVKDFASKKISVSGGVKAPESYAMVGGRSRFSDVLLRAGGLVDPAAPRAEVWRDIQGVRQIIPIDLERLRRGEAEGDIELLAGDHLYVPEVDQVYVDGQVGKPGGVAYRDGMKLTEAITQAGSMTSLGRAQGVTITRGAEQIRVNLRRVLAGKEADFALKPKDHIYIPEATF